MFETRDAERRAWRGWTKHQTYQRVDLHGVGLVESWEELDEVADPLVSFRSWTVFGSDGAALVSESTLRFRSLAEVTESLQGQGYELRDVRAAPDRPRREMVFVAQRP